jgi:hypothetical protein
MPRIVINNGDSGLTVRNAINDMTADIFAGNIFPTVANFAALPAAASHTDEIYRVTTSTGIWLVNRYNKGLYSSDGVNWNYIGDYPVTAADLAFVPAGTVSAVNTQAAIEELDTEKAPTASPTFTGTVSGITKSMVGLANVDNTTDLNKPISTATQTALDSKVDEGPVTTSGLTQATARLLGRWSAATGAIQEVSVGDGLILTGTGILEATHVGTRVEDEGATVVAAATALNFAGSGVTVTDAGGGEALVTISGGGGGGSITVEDEGTPLTTAVTLFNFVGAGVTVTEPVADQVTVTIPGVDIQVFTVGGSTTWTKPAGVSTVRVLCIGGGGGGGSGRKGAAAAVRCGGGAGSGASFIDEKISAAALGATETVTVGVGGTGAAAMATNSTNGNNGGNGGATIFGSFFRATGGTNGAGGTASAGNGGTAPAGPFPGSAGANAAGTGGAGSSGARPTKGASGGGGGGGITTANVASAGGAGGGDNIVIAGSTATGGGGASGAIATNGGTVAGRATNDWRPGQGGGGGGSSLVGNAGAGGAGQFPGGGGGGGGAAVDSVGNSGAGGAGGAGLCVVISY